MHRTVKRGRGAFLLLRQVVGFGPRPNGLTWFFLAVLRKVHIPCAPVSPACLASAGAPPVKGRCGARVLGCACGPRQRLRFLP